RGAGAQRDHRGSRAKRAHRAVARDAALGKYPQKASGADDFRARAERPDEARLAPDGDRVEPAQDRPEPAVGVELARDEESHGAARPQADEDRVQERRVIRSEDRGAGPREVLASLG